MTINFSVIIPTADRPEMLLKAISSASKNCKDGDEIIVVDNGYVKLDSSVVKKAVANDIRLLYAPPMCGVSNARNFGAWTAKNNWLAFLDDDDVWTENYLDVAISIIEDNENSDAVLGRKDKVLNGIQLPYKKPDSEKLIIRNLLWENCCAGGSNLLVKRSSFLEINGFDRKLQKREDRSLLLDLLLSEKQIISSSALGSISFDKQMNDNGLNRYKDEDYLRDIVFFKKYSALLTEEEKERVFSKIIQGLEAAFDRAKEENFYTKIKKIVKGVFIHDN